MRNVFLLAAFMAASFFVAGAQQTYPTWQSAALMTSVPATETQVQSSTVYLNELDLSDPSGTAVTVTIYDGNGVVYSIPMGGTNPTILSWPFVLGVPFTGGISWQASVAGTVKGHLWGGIQ